MPIRILVTGYIAALLLAVVGVACCGDPTGFPRQAPDMAPAPSIIAWTAEMRVGFAPDHWYPLGIAGATTTSSFPIVVLLAPQTVEKGGPYARFVCRHEFLHALGWMGHPHHGPDDKVIYMDKWVPGNIANAKDGDIVCLPEPSDLERWFVQEEKATLLIRCEPELEELVRDAADFWNGIAGREVFIVRASPATMTPGDG